MKTIKDLENMKNMQCEPFENLYEYFMAKLEDDYISKSDGINRIKYELSQWDENAQNTIVEQLIQNITQSSSREMNYKELKCLLSRKREKIALYFDESGNNGNVVPNQYGNLYRKHQSQFVLASVMCKGNVDENSIQKKYSSFKCKWNIEGEFKSISLLKEENKDMLEDFIENVLDCVHFYICCYDKKFYLASVISFYLLGNSMQIENPLFYYKYTSALAREDNTFFNEYCKIVKCPTDKNIEEFLKYVLEYKFTKIDEVNPYKYAAQVYLERGKREGYPKPYLSKGEYEREDNMNVINMNALGESILAICYNEKITVDDLEVYHDKIEQYEPELIEIYDKRVKVEFLDSKSNIMIQIADNLSGIFRRAFSETIEIFSSRDQCNMEKVKFPKLLAKLMSKITVKNIKFVTPIADWALALTVQKIFTDTYPEQSRTRDNFWLEFMSQRKVVEETIKYSDYSYSPD